MDKATSEGKELFLLGDFNCDFLIKCSSILECRQLKSLFKCFHIKQVIKEATRVTPDSKTFIDLIAANNPHNISSSGVISCGLIDHEMVYCVRKINWKRAPGLIKTFRNYVKYDPKKFCDELKDANLPQNLLIMKICVTSVAENHAPIIQKPCLGNR